MCPTVIYVASETATKRVMASMTTFREEVWPCVEGAKDASSRPADRKFLGYTAS